MCFFLYSKGLIWLLLVELALSGVIELDQVGNEKNNDLEERERDFMGWVERVGERVKKASEEGKAGGSLISTKGNNTNDNSININKNNKNNNENGTLISVIRVDKMGSMGGHTSVQGAINSVPSGNNGRVVIHIPAGLYEEKVRIPKSKKFITLEGDGASSTIISWGDTISSAGTLANSATVAVDSDYFIARGISFKNSAPAPPGGVENKQGVALRISGDKAAFYDCNFLGAQDTLFDDQGKHYFQNCFIQGSIDFICGDGQSLYKGCTLRAISSGSFTAQRRSSSNSETGFSFVDCKVTGSGMLYLGRAWGPYSRVVFSYSYMDKIVIPSGWFNWGDSSRDRTTFYGEYKCSGPGANQNGRAAWAKQLTDIQVAPFQSISFIDGSSWLET